MITNYLDTATAWNYKPICLRRYRLILTHNWKRFGCTTVMLFQQADSSDVLWDFDLTTRPLSDQEKRSRSRSSGSGFVFIFFWLSGYLPPLIVVSCQYPVPYDEVYKPLIYSTLMFAVSVSAYRRLLSDYGWIDNWAVSSQYNGYVLFACYKYMAIYQQEFWRLFFFLI